ncbi:putative phage tail protein [Halalkalibacter sp. AB-rgal2]|uniref:putative phage tail protein n=1 Tax=Halalkalibacter sp. AB-rgal2 TaxID=3242695 RepID=UPI00359E5CC8
MINNVVTSESAQHMLQMVINMYDQDEYSLWMYQVNGFEMDDLQNWTNDMREQVVPQLATWALEYYEEMLGLHVRNNMDIEARRLRILTQMNTFWPITPFRMEMIISQVARAPVQIIQNVSPYCFRVSIFDQFNELDLRVVSETIENAKPAHLSYEFDIHHQSQIQIKSGSKMYEIRFPRAGTFRAGQKPGGL